MIKERSVTKLNIMKILILSIIIHFIAFNVNGQTNKKYFSNTLLEQTNTYSDSINYFLLKIKCIRSGKIDKIDVTFFRNDSILNMQLKDISLAYSIGDIVSDSSFDIESIKSYKFVLCPFIIKNVKFIKNPSTDLTFNSKNIEKIFQLLKIAYTSTHSNYKLATPSILFIEESYH